MAARTVAGIASEERIASFTELTASHYEGEPVNDPAFVRWRHLQSPTGPSATVELVDGDDVVGRMWINVVAWSVGGREVRAANPVDFLIREDHRRLPAFMGLFRSTMKEASVRADLVYHTSNPLTDDLYRKLMKLQPVTELDGALVPTRPFGAAEATGVFRSGVVGRGVDSAFSVVLRGIGALAQLFRVRLGDAPPDPVQQEILAQFVAEEQVCNSRGSAHRAWRHRGAGVIRYDERWVFHRGRAIGYVVTSDRDLGDVRGCFVVDVVLPGRPSALVVASMWLQVAAAASRRGRHAVFFLHNCANPRLARLARLPMITVDRSRLPQRVPVFVRAGGETDAAILADVDLSAGYFVLTDFDMF